MKTLLKTSSAKWRPFCPEGDELTIEYFFFQISQRPLKLFGIMGSVLISVFMLIWTVLISFVGALNGRWANGIWVKANYELIASCGGAWFRTQDIWIPKTPPIAAGSMLSFSAMTHPLECWIKPDIRNEQFVNIIRPRLLSLCLN